MAEYEVQIDVTMSGSLYIDASSEKEAREIVKKRLENVTASDLRSFSCIGKEIIDVWKTEE